MDIVKLRMINFRLEKNYIDIVAAFIIVLVISSVTFTVFYKSYMLRNYGHCTVGISVEEEVGSYGKEIVLYKFEVGGKLFFRRQHKPNYLNTLGSKYVVVYYKLENGSIMSVIVLEMPIPKDGFSLGDDITILVDKKKIDFDLSKF